MADPTSQRRSYHVTVDGAVHVVTVVSNASGTFIEQDGKLIPAELALEPGETRHAAKLDRSSRRFGLRRTRDGLEIVIEGTVYAAQVQDERSVRFAALARPAAGTRVAPVKAPMPGLIVTVGVREGDEVKKGQSLLTLNAMKLENDIRSPADGRIKRVLVAPNQSVEKGAVLVELG